MNMDTKQVVHDVFLFADHDWALVDEPYVSVVTKQQSSFSIKLTYQR